MSRLPTSRQLCTSLVWLALGLPLWTAASCGSAKSEGDAAWSPADGFSIDLAGLTSEVAASAPDSAATDGVQDGQSDWTAGDAASAAGDAAPKDQTGPVDVLADTVGGADVQTQDAQEPSPDSGPEAVCGDGICSGAESWSTCSLDCAAPKGVCGDLTCTPGENAINCQLDCDPDTAGVFKCLKTQCASQTSTCLAAQECIDFLSNGAQCLANCVDADCIDFCKGMTSPNGGAAAVAQCGFLACSGAAAAAICGDGSCGTGESASSCPADCGGGSSGGGGCADGICSPGETVDDCPMDCDADFQKAWACGKAKCPKEADNCKADPKCLSALASSAKCLKQCGSGQSCVSQCRGPVMANSAALAYAACGLQNCQ